LIKRQGESGAIPYRTGRYFSQNGAWYFMTREGRTEGPYRERREAELAVDMYIRMAHSRNVSAAPVTRTFTSPPARVARATVSSGLIQ
jgi:hypothetical protein